MIRVEYRRKYHTLTVSGHAGAAPFGEDIVCAGVSALVNALGVEVQIQDKQGCLLHMDVTITPGHALITALPWPWARGKTTRAFDMTARGLAMMARDWPKHVSFLVV